MENKEVRTVVVHTVFVSDMDLIMLQLEAVSIAICVDTMHVCVCSCAHVCLHGKTFVYVSNPVDITRKLLRMARNVFQRYNERCLYQS